MEPVVERTRHDVGRHRDRTTLEQTFRFEGRTAEAVAAVLRSAPLVGDHSIFGDRPGAEVDTATPSRRLRGFSPAPGFQFDVELAEPEDLVFVASFSQPDRKTPYLEGDAAWFLSDGSGGALFEEAINTERALDLRATPLAGTRPSMRRWLFFRVGHAQVMRDATRRLARLATGD